MFAALDNVYDIFYSMPNITDTEYAMSYREKSAWISLLAHAVVYGIYFTALAGIWGEAYTGPVGVTMLFAAVVAFVVIAAILHIVAAATGPKAASAPIDEREKLIDLKAERIAAFAMGVVVVLSMGALLMDWDGFLVANMLLGALVLAEIVKAGAQIAYFRGGV